MKIFRFALLFFLVVPCVLAQTVTVSTTQLSDGIALANGTICWVPVLSSGIPTVYRKGSGGLATATPICVPVVNGVSSISAIADSVYTTPAYLCWRVTLSTANGASTLGSCVQPSSANYWYSAGVDNFDNWTPSIPPLPTIAYVQSVNGCTGVCMVTGGGGSMTWPGGGAGVPNYNGSSGWGTNYNASNPLPANFLPGSLVYNGQANTFGAYLQDLSAASVKLPAGFLSGDCTWTALGVITCTKSNGSAFGTGAFASAYSLPGAVVQTGQINTYGAFLQDFSAASVKLPVGFLSGDCTWTALGVIACTKSNGSAFGSGAFVSAYSLPGTVVQTGQSNAYGAFLQDFSAASVKLPASLLSGDCTWTALGVITCTKSNGSAFGTGAFASAYSLPGAVVQTGQINTYGAFLQDFSAASVKLPAGFLSGDCTWTALGVITCTKSNGISVVTNGGPLGTPSSGNGSNITNLAYTALPALSANQILGALTATTPSGLNMPSCSGATSALTWTTGTGMGCNTISAGGTVTDGSGSTTAGQSAVSTGTAHVFGFNSTLLLPTSGCSSTSELLYVNSANQAACSSALTNNVLLVMGGSGPATASIKEFSSTLLTTEQFFSANGSTTLAPAASITSTTFVTTGVAAPATSTQAARVYWLVCNMFWEQAATVSTVTFAINNTSAATNFYAFSNTEPLQLIFPASGAPTPITTSPTAVTSAMVPTAGVNYETTISMLLSQSTSASTITIFAEISGSGGALTIEPTSHCSNN